MLDILAMPIQLFTEANEGNEGMGPLACEGDPGEKRTDKAA